MPIIHHYHAWHIICTISMLYLTFQPDLMTVGILDVRGKGSVQDDFLVWGPSDPANKHAINRAILEVEQPRL